MNNWIDLTTQKHFVCKRKKSLFHEYDKEKTFTVQLYIAAYCLFAICFTLTVT